MDKRGIFNMRNGWLAGVLSVILCLVLVFSIVGVVQADDGGRWSNPYVVRTFVDEEGREIAEIIVPGRPPEIKAAVATVPEPNPAMGINVLSNVPAFDWCYGCSATSAAMLFGYYDNTGCDNMYAGPTNGGVCPMDNTGWGQTPWPSIVCGECPLSATHQGIDGRAIPGHVDDYWVDYDDPGPDPFIGNWAEHTYGDCTGDYMGTNQSLFDSVDGETMFYYYTDGDPLYDYTGHEPDGRDGCHGMRLFAESRGYSIVQSGGNPQNFSQYIKGQGSDPNKGFTFEDFIAEIDAGRPVLIQVVGHTMLGYGYDTSGQIVYIHDTWDYNDHSMTWGGTYGAGNLQHEAVTVIQLEAAGQPDITVFPPSFEVTLPPDTTQDYTLTIGNNGGATLAYSISEEETTGLGSSTAQAKQPSRKYSPLQKGQLRPQSLGSDLVLTNTGYDMSIAVADWWEYGRYTEATADEPPKKLLYGYPSAWSSYMTVRLDGSDYYEDFDNMDPHVTQTPTIVDNSIVTEWTLPTDVDVAQVLTLMENTTEYRVTVTNNDSTSHNVKVRYLFDTMLAYEDGAPFIVPGVGNVVTEQEYVNPVFDYWKATDSLVSPTLTSHCIFDPSNKPYKVQFAYWPDIYDVPFDYVITPGQDITWDTAVGMYWDLGTLSLGETKDVIVYYGTAEAVIGEPEVSITDLFTDSDTYAPEEDVNIYVDVGNGGDTALVNGEVVVNVENPSEVLVFEDSSTITVNPQEVVSRNFSYSLPADAIGGTYVVTAEVYDAEDTLLDDAAATFGVSGADCPWLDEEPKSGTVPPGGEADITVTFDTIGLGSTYTANIIISSNDPDENPKIVPVTLHVSSGNNAPNTPSNPSPANDATGVLINADLSWTGGDPDAGDTVTYDVYFGTSVTPPLVFNDQSATTYDPGTLNNSTKYYWKIVATDNHGAPTTGPIWDFTTQAEAGRKGDFTGDGHIDLVDFFLFAAAYGSELGDDNYNSAGDFDDNGVINLYDFFLFAAVYGT